MNDDYSLRVQQLGEIRAMLGLPIDATHETVMRVLFDMGKAPRPDMCALPERYRDRVWARH